MSAKAQFKVYDEVWVMHYNVPTKFIVFAVIESMNFTKTGTEIRYRLVSSRIGAGWGNNEGFVYERPFAAREALLASLAQPEARP